MCHLGDLIAEAQKQKAEYNTPSGGADHTGRACCGLGLGSATLSAFICVKSFK